MRDQQLTGRTGVPKDEKYEINIYGKLGYSLRNIFLSKEGLILTLISSLGQLLYMSVNKLSLLQAILISIHIEMNTHPNIK